jgi:cytochrome P450
MDIVDTSAAEAEAMFAEVNAARDALMGIGIVHNPYPRYHELREQCPVHEGTLTGLFDFVGGDGLLFPDRRHVVAVRYDMVEAILKDVDGFSSAWYAPQLEPSIGRSILQMDPPDHQRHRLVVQPAFSLTEMRWWRTEYVEPACHQYIDEFVDRGSVDLYPEFCVKLPIHVISVALGLPTDRLALFHAHAVKLTSGGTRPEEAIESVAAIEGILRPLVEERRANPGRDLISVIAQGTVPDEEGHAQQLTDDEILTFCKLLLPAGANTTYRSLGLLLTTLFRHPDVLDRIRSDRALVPAVVEELVRIEHTTSLVGRVCTRSTDLDGTVVEPGDIVLLALAAANHDPARWDEPEAFDPDRKPLPNIAFGWGRHRCLGVHLARMELVTALDVLLDRLPNLRAKAGVEPAEITGLMFRAPTHVWAEWDRHEGSGA